MNTCLHGGTVQASSHDDVSACIIKCDSAYKIGHMYTLNLLALKFKMLKLTMLLKFF